jgi:glyoxylase-like metal-dependent hydrolase (beta-lactamase superfamily II)
VALALVAPLVAACGSSDDDADAGSQDADGRSDQAADQTSTTSANSTTSAGSEVDQPSELRWGRANLGFVSAYVLARGTEAAIVDTGVAGSADAIGRTLTDLGLSYSDVAHLILTHKHGDHIGSMNEIVEQATSAAIYAGEADLGGIDASAIDDDIVALTGGEEVFGLEMLSTPGHTAGHMAAIDHDSGLLVAGDAIFTESGGVIEGPERFFDDVPASRRSIQELAKLSFNTLLVGHGEPLEGGADTAVAALAQSFG